MKRLLEVFALFALSAAVAFAQPVVGGILNAASYALPGLPNSGIAQGSLFTVFGTGFGSATPAPAFPLPISTANTSVQVTVGGTAVDAYMIYSLGTQLTAILPSNTPIGTGTLTVTTSGQRSATAPITVVRSAFGAFSVNQAGSGPGIVQNFVSQTDLPVNALTRPARPGQTLILWGTGLGAASVANERNQAVPGDIAIDGGFEVYVGGRLATVTYKGRSGCCAGTDQIVFVVPQGVEGCYAPVVVKTGAIVSNYTSIAVAATGNSCTDVNGISGPALDAARLSGNYRNGGIALTRSNTKITAAGFSVESKIDAGSAFFHRYNFDALLASQGGTQAAVTLGACTVFTFRGNDGSFVDPIKPVVLDAGPTITVSNHLGAKQLTRSADGFYSGELANTTVIPGLPSPPGTAPYLEPGNYTITNNAGGPDVGPFSTTLTLGPTLNWTNQDATTTVNRGGGLPITWSGGDPAGQVFISGVTISNSVGAGFVCYERASAGSFNVPSHVLLSLPPTGTTASDFGILSVSGSTVKSFTATGLDAATVSASTVHTKTVSFR